MMCAVRRSTSARSVISDLLGIAIEPTYFDLAHHQLDPAEVVRIAADTGANALRVGMFSHQGHAYYPSRIAPEAPFLDGRNLLQEFELACKRRDVYLTVYLNSKWVSEDFYRQHPDWLVSYRDGPFTFRTVDPDTKLVIYPMCPCSPFTDYYEQIVREVVNKSSPDAIYVDNFAIMPFCECRCCQERYGAEIPERRNWNSRETRRYLKWLADESKVIAKSIVAAARSRIAEMPVVFNRGQFWSVTGTFSPEDNRDYAHQIADMIHAESAVRFYGESFRHINEQCVFGRSIDTSVWTWVEYGAYPFSYVSCPSRETKIKAAKVMANGGRPMVWNMPCAPLVNQEGMAGLKDVFALVSAHQACFNNVSFDKCIAILHSSKSVQALCLGDEGKLEEYRKSFAGAYELALRCHLPFDFVLDRQLTPERLRQYRVLILPNAVCLGQKACRAIEGYVENGGAVFATSETSLYNSRGRRLKDFALGSLLNARYVGELGDQLEGFCAGYCRFTAEHPVNRNGLREHLFPAGGKYLAVKSSDGIATLLEPCRYYCDHPQRETPYPAIVARTYGRGKVIYVAGEFCKLYHEKGLLAYKQFFRQSVDWFVGDRLPVVTDLPDTVELTIASNANGAKIVHLVNCSFDESRPVEHIAPLRGHSLRLETTRAYTTAIDISTGQQVALEIREGYVRLELPELTGYNVIVLKTCARP